MANRYFQISTKTEVLDNPLVPAHIQYDSGNPDHVAIDENNPFFSTLPEGQQIAYDGGGLPIGLEPIPAPVYTTEEQAFIDLVAAGVTTVSLTNARYADSRGDGSLLTALDAAVDAVVISSGLTLSQVIALIE